VLGGLLTQPAGRRYVLLVDIVGIAVAAAAPRLPPEPARAHGRTDVTGAVLGTAGVGVHHFVALPLQQVAGRSADRSRPEETV
jgi:hypothetical protein